MGAQSPPEPPMALLLRTTVLVWQARGGGLEWSVEGPPFPASELWRRTRTRVLLGCDLCHAWHGDPRRGIVGPSGRPWR